MAQCTTKEYFQGGKMQQVAKKKKDTHEHFSIMLVKLHLGLIIPIAN